jgi:hypothetical protein
MVGRSGIQERARKEIMFDRKLDKIRGVVTIWVMMTTTIMIVNMGRIGQFQKFICFGEWA